MVDCLNTPAVPDLRPLEEVLPESPFDDYERLRLRRPPVMTRYVPPPPRPPWHERLVRHPPAATAFWMENPHALLSLLWAAVSTVGLAAGWGTVRRRQPRATGSSPAFTEL